MTNNAPTRRKDRQEAKKAEEEFNPGKGRQLACLVSPLLRTAGLYTNPVKHGDHDSEIDWIDSVWTHPKMIELCAWLDAQKAGWAAQYKWARSSLLFVVVVSLLLRMTVSEAHNRVRTDSDLRRIGGFEPRPPRGERRALYGSEAATADETFPTRQSVDDFVTRWVGGKKKCGSGCEDRGAAAKRDIVSERGLQALALIEKLMQEVAFDAILTYDLDCTRLVVDGSLVPSGHKRLNAFRPDNGATSFTKDENTPTTFARMHGGLQLIAVPFTLHARVFTNDEGEPGMLKKVLLPGAVDASERLIEYAADHRIEHKGFSNAMMCGDRAFHNHPCIEATNNAGFLAAYDVGGDKGEILRHEKRREASRELPVFGTGELKEVDLRDDGALLCRCSPSMRGEREPMRRTIEQRFSTAHVHCEHCDTTYVTSPRAQDKIMRYGREQGDIDLRFDVTLPRWNPRVAAICFKGRNGIEQMHGEMMSMGLLPDGRGGDGWRSVTGDFRHEFWYALGHLLWNIRVAHNLSQTYHELQVYTWAEGLEGLNRNRHKLARQAELARKRADVAAQQGGATGKKRRKGRPPGKGERCGLSPKPLGRREPRPLQATLGERATRLRTERSA